MSYLLLSSRYNLLIRPVLVQRGLHGGVGLFEHGVGILDGLGVDALIDLRLERIIDAALVRHEALVMRIVEVVNRAEDHVVVVPP